MKSAFLFCGALMVVGCASAQKPEATSPSTTSAEAPASAGAPAGETKGEAADADGAPQQTAAERWAETKVEADTKKPGATKSDFDPLAMNDPLENAAIPKIEMTPAKELRNKSRGDLDASVSLVSKEATVEDAAKKLVARLGKPTWVENGTRRVWVVAAGAQCHRLVLDSDGSVEVESAAKSEWRMLAATASQNPCTGEIKRGIGK